MTRREDKYGAPGDRYPRGAKKQDTSSAQNGNRETFYGGTKGHSPGMCEVKEKNPIGA